MRFNYKNKDYELAELVEPNKNETFDINAIFELVCCIWKDNDLVQVTKDEYEKSNNNFEKLELVDYFYGSDEDDDSLVSVAKEFIDRREQECHKL